MNFRTICLAAAVAMCAIPAEAAFHFFRIDQVYSSSDGEVQYIVIREATGANNEHRWNGITLSTTNKAMQGKQINFPSDLSSATTANRSVLVATPGFAALGIITPDFTIPARFIPTDGGDLDYAGVDVMTLPPLPTDGAMAINRNGQSITGTPRNFANATATMTAGPVRAVEFYNAGLDHFFVSSLAPDIDALDSGRLSGWMRTGQTIGVYPSIAAGGAGAAPVCRIIIPPPFGDSHFFGRSPQECQETLMKFPFMSQETPNAYYVTLPAAGVCPADTVPIYRVFSNRMDANHRYMTNAMLRDQMVMMGWTAEGDGPDMVVMCGTPPL